ncbi:L-aspartate oxidase [bacterium]|nr:L-aspartate oxidase [bacterium]
MKKSKYSALIIGSGIAGLFAALELSKYKNLHDGILIISKGKLDEGSSKHAQGGMVAVMEDNKKDTVESHIKDTLVSGCGLSEFGTVENISTNSCYAVEKLLSYGVKFDCDENNNLKFTLEGAHSVPRILHCGGDATGFGIESGLLSAVKNKSDISIYENTMAIELLKDKTERIKGAIIYNSQNCSYEAVISSCVILATGGMGQLYKYTTNPYVATADGQAIAYRAGAKLRDMEFMQFHPTSLAIDKYNNRFLISEALRGEGAKLVDLDGNQFMAKYDKRKELATRDIVTRAIYSEMQNLKYHNMYLDITHHSKEFLQKRFPTIFNMCLENHIDISKDLIPVSPAAHYSMGGVETDANGKTNLDGLFAIGEVASSGLHGANRLASNSLLECVVMADNLVKSLKDYNFTCSDIIDEKVLNIMKKYQQTDYENEVQKTNIYELKTRLKNIMWNNVGIIRSQITLKKALNEIADIEKEFNSDGVCSNKEEYELANMITVSKLIAESALNREESRGSHYREDFPFQKEEAEHTYIKRGIENNGEIFTS